MGEARKYEGAKGQRGKERCLAKARRRKGKGEKRRKKEFVRFFC
jgi:hypothetical protein